MTTFLGIAPFDWGVLGIALVAMVLAWAIARWIAGLILDRRERATGREMRPTLRREVKGAFGLTAGAWTGTFSLAFLPLTGRPLLFLDRGLSAIGLVGVSLLALAVIDVATTSIRGHVAGRDERAERLLVPVARKFGRAAVFTLAALAGLTIFGVNVAGVIAGLGIGGLVVALAAKDSVENVFGSLTILFDMPFALGDWIKVAGVEGSVEEINLRSTRIKTADESIVTLPNSNLIRAAVENFGPRQHRRVRTTIPIGHPTPPERTTRFLLEMRTWLGARPDVDGERILVEASEYAEGTLNLLVQAWVLAPTAAQEARARSEILLRIEELRAECDLLKPGF